MITASHQTSSGQFWHLPVKFDLTRLLGDTHVHKPHTPLN